MSESDVLLDRSIPDLVAVDGLPLALAAEVDHLAGRHGPWSTRRPGVHPGVQARALAALGDLDGARVVLGRCAEVPWTVPGAAAALWAASRVGGEELSWLGVVAEVLDGAMAGGFVEDQGAPLAVRSQLAGLSCLAAGDLEGATISLRHAVVAGDQRAPLWGALARLELARLLATFEDLELGNRAPPSPAEVLARAGATARSLTACRAFFAAGGYRNLERLARSVTEPACTPVGAPGVGHLVPGPTWAIGFGAPPPVTVRDRPGLRAVRHVIAHRHRAVPVAELAAVIDAEPFELADYLDSVLAGANDGGGGSLSMTDERTRSRVTKALRRTIGSLDKVHPALGSHLRRSVQIGSLCRYDARSTLVWDLGP